MPHPHAPHPIMPQPWGAYTCTYKNGCLEYTGVCARFPTRQAALEWAQTHPNTLDSCAWIQRLDIPEYLCTPEDIIVFRGNYTINNGLAAHAQAAGLLPTMFMNGIWTTSLIMKNTQQISVEWTHTLPEGVPISLQLIGKYQRTWSTSPVTLLHRTNIGVAAVFLDPHTLQQCEQAPSVQRIPPSSDEDILPALERILTARLSKHPGLSAHARVHALRRILPHIEPSLTQIIAPSYTLD